VTDVFLQTERTERPDETRVVLRRCVAWLLDLLSLALVLIVVVWVTGDVKRVPNCDTIPAGRACFAYNDNALLVNSNALVWFFLSLVLMVALVFILPQAVAGATAGKTAMGIRVVRRDGSPPGGLRSTIRVVAWVVDGIMLLLPVALWSALVTPGHRRVGDLAAGTFVVRRRAVGQPVRFASRPWQAQVPSIG
jgi:uncharacterized RDD family membrane protein YckC